MLRSCVAISKGIMVTICKINIFSIVTSICPKYHVHTVQKVVEKFSFSEVKTKKSLLSKLLTFYTIFNVRPFETCLLIQKKRVLS